MRIVSKGETIQVLGRAAALKNKSVTGGRTRESGIEKHRFQIAEGGAVIGPK